MVLCLSSWSQVSPSKRDLIAQVKQAERKAFPRNEALDFDAELSKRNVELLLVIEDAPMMSQQKVVAYSVVTRTRSIAFLHKLCVLELYRRRGIGIRLLRFSLEKPKRSGCSKMQLWVDERREAAKSLYSKVGFEELERIRDYYAPNRPAIKMVLQMR